MADYDIVRALEKIEKELMESMIRNLDHHRAMETDEGFEWSQWQVEQIKALENYKKKNRKKYDSQFKDINKQLGALIYLARNQGNMDQEIRILEAIKKGFTGYHKPLKNTVATDAAFFRVNDKKIDALIEATTNDFEKAEHAMLRRANDQYRKIIFDAQVYANAGGTTYEKAVDMALNDFLKAGINCIEYANGSRHTMKDYADMCIRTATKRAYLTGEGEKRKEWGIATVIMNKRGNACPKCVPFVGKVMIDDVWSGGKPDGKHLLMSRAIEAGLYHPRCKDSHTTYFEGISTLEGKPYTEEEKKQIIEDYNKEQKVNYCKRQAEQQERMADMMLDKDNKKIHSMRAKEWKNKEHIADNSQSSIIELYRKGSTHRKISDGGWQIIDKATYNKITKPAIKSGADIRIAEGDYLEHIRKQGTAVTVGDIIFFTPEATISDVLEEIYHFYQYKKGLNNKYSYKQREVMNEIDAKEYLLSMTDKYNIPEEEVYVTREHLKSYKKQMEEMKERGEWNE